MSESNNIASGRELEVLQLIVDGFSANKIAAKLNITHDTVSAHRKSLKKKLDAGNVASLVAQAFRKGLVK